MIIWRVGQGIQFGFLDSLCDGARKNQVALVKMHHLNKMNNKRNVVIYMEYRLLHAMNRCSRHQSVTDQHWYRRLIQLPPHLVKRINAFVVYVTKKKNSSEQLDSRSRTEDMLTRFFFVLNYM